jgi:hypothetical protein
MEGLVEGSEASMVFTLYDRSDGTKTNMTGYTSITLFWRIDGGTLVTKTPTVTDAANGEVTYTPATTNLTPGRIWGRVEWVDSNSKRRDPEAFSGDIEPRN